MKNILAFLAQHPVFTRKELVNFLENQGTTSPNTQTAILQYHLKQGHIVHIKRGLFASIPPGSDPNTHPVDPYLIAGKAAPDAVLSYHTALEYHGLAYTVFNNFTFCTNMRQQLFMFRDYAFDSTIFPGALRMADNSTQANEFFATETVKRQGIPIRVTNIERTFVDVLDKPDNSGGWEEVYRSIESITVMNLDLVVEYALLLKKANTAAKVGYFLEKMRESLGTTEKQLQPLEEHLPKKPHYLNRSQRKGGVFFKRWNLIVPAKVTEQQWDEPNYDD